MIKFPINVEKELRKRIRAAEHALRHTPHDSVREAVIKQLEKLYKELKEVQTPK